MPDKNLYHFKDIGGDDIHVVGEKAVKLGKTMLQELFCKRGNQLA